MDARYEKVRENGVIQSRAVQVAIGIDREGRRQVLEGGVGEPGERDELAGVFAQAQGAEIEGSEVGGERRPCRAEEGDRGGGVADMLCAFFAQRTRPSPRKANDNCLAELRRLYDRRNVE